MGKPAHSMNIISHANDSEIGSKGHQMEMTSYQYSKCNNLNFSLYMLLFNVNFMKMPCILIFKSLIKVFPRDIPG